MLVKISRYRIVYLLQSHYNIICNVVGIYWWNFSIELITSITSSAKLICHRTICLFFIIFFVYVDNFVCKTYMSLHYLFFLFFFSYCIFLVYMMWIFLSMFTDEIIKERNRSIIVTIINLTKRGKKKGVNVAKLVLIFLFIYSSWIRICVFK